MSFNTIVPNYNEQPAAAQAHIHVTAHIDIEMVKDRASSTLNWPTTGRI